MVWCARCIERGYGFPTPAAPVPIVPAAVLYDLRPGAVAWPDADAGYAACEAASHETLSGRVGAGTGASVGILLGDALPSPGGIELAARTLPAGNVVVAVVAVEFVRLGARARRRHIGRDTWPRRLVLRSVQRDRRSR